jgi:very-short-patch-repair endonuclease
MAREFARQLRKDMTDAERWLWYELRARRFDEMKFRRQVPIGDYIVDFVCHRAKLIVELDGSQHALFMEKDNERTAWLNSRGYRVLRFWNYQIFEEPGVVLEAIWNAVRLDPSPQPSPARGEGAGADLSVKTRSTP